MIFFYIQLLGRESAGIAFHTSESIKVFKQAGTPLNSLNKHIKEYLMRVSKNTQK